jgi:hypothetical protein
MKIRDRVWILAIVLLFISFCGSQYIIYMQNQTISAYSDLIDDLTEAYGRCMGGKVFKGKDLVEISHKL